MLTVWLATPSFDNQILGTKKPTFVGWLILDNLSRRDGTRGRTRTVTLLRAGDFESPVSTNFTTLAHIFNSFPEKLSSENGANYTVALRNRKCFPRPICIFCIVCLFFPLSVFLLGNLPQIYPHINAFAHRFAQAEWGLCCFFALWQNFVIYHTNSKPNLTELLIWIVFKQQGLY